MWLNVNERVLNLNHLKRQVAMGPLTCHSGKSIGAINITNDFILFSSVSQYWDPEPQLKLLVPPALLFSFSMCQVMPGALTRQVCCECCMLCVTVTFVTSDLLQSNKL